MTSTSIRRTPRLALDSTARYQEIEHQLAALQAPCDRNPMNSPQDDTGPVALWRLTAEQRQKIYEEEKRRIEDAAPVFSRKTKVIAAVYFLGCLLLYFGIPQAVGDFGSIRSWKLAPEPELFYSLFEAARTLIRPFIAFWFVGMILVIPVGFVLLLGGWGIDTVGSLKRLLNRDERNND